MKRIPRNPRPRQARQRGVMLLEVMVAILIFSFGILGTVGLLARATQFSTNAEDRNRAALLANELATEMWASRNLRVDTTRWQARVEQPNLDNRPNPDWLPNSDGNVTVAFDPAIGADVATISVEWRPTFARAGDPPNRFVTQVLVP